jgi:coproporphyrinogen III oxidase
MNVRFFVVEAVEPVWYFGGGYDLTPYYGFVEDVQHWHKIARAAVGTEAYPAMKQRCDEYFFLPHRSEARGVGGIFFDDWTTGGFSAAAALVGRVGSSLIEAYAPIFEGRTDTAYGPEQRNFQAYRRGRYAEFNLAIDRGTRYGLQSGRRVESVLASLPPEAHWLYDYSPTPGSAEAALTSEFLPPRDWLESCG